MSYYRENITDQIGLFSAEVARAVRDIIEDYGFDPDQALRIVQLASENIKAETFHHVFTNLHDGTLSVTININGGD